MRSAILVIAAILTACDGTCDPELMRHRAAYSGTYYVPSPWRNVVPLAQRDNPEDGETGTAIGLSAKPAWR